MDSLFSLQNAHTLDSVAIYRNIFIILLIHLVCYQETSGLSKLGVTPAVPSDIFASSFRIYHIISKTSGAIFKLLCFSENGLWIRGFHWAEVGTAMPGKLSRQICLIQKEDLCLQRQRRSLIPVGIVLIIAMTLFWLTCFDWLIA